MTVCLAYRLLNIIRKKLHYILIFLLLSCKVKLTTNTTVVKEQDILAFELCQIYGADQVVRHAKGFPNRVNLMQHMDTLNFQKVISFIKEHGMPRVELLGEENMSHECVEGSVTSVLLHNPHLLANNKENLEILINEVEKNHLKKEYLATLLDKYYWVKRDEFGNRKVLYGTQFGKPCLKYRKQSDSVRAIIKLAPLPETAFINCNNSK